MHRLYYPYHKGGYYKARKKDQREAKKQDRQAPHRQSQTNAYRYGGNDHHYLRHNLFIVVYPDCPWHTLTPPFFRGVSYILIIPLYEGMRIKKGFFLGGLNGGALFKTCYEVKHL